MKSERMVTAGLEILPKELGQKWKREQNVIFKRFLFLFQR